MFQRIEPGHQVAVGGLPSGAVTGDGLVFITWTSKSGSQSAGTIAAFTETCGTGGAACTPVWTAPTVAGSASPTVANGVVYVSHGPGELWAFPTRCGGSKTCDPLWVGIPGHTNLNFTGVPSVGDGLFYTVTDQGLLAISERCHSPATCAARWVASLPDGAYPPGVADHVAYVSSASADGTLSAYATNCAGDGSTYEPLWEGRIGEPLNWIPTPAGGLVFVGSQEGHVFALVDCGRATACPPVWSATVGTGPVNPPAVADGMLFVGSSDGLHAYAPGPPPVSSSKAGAPIFYGALLLAGLLGLSIWVGRRLRSRAHVTEGRHA